MAAFGPHAMCNARDRFVRPCQRCNQSLCGAEKLDPCLLIAVKVIFLRGRRLQFFDEMLDNFEARHAPLSSVARSEQNPITPSFPQGTQQWERARGVGVDYLPGGASGEVRALGVEAGIGVRGSRLWWWMICKRSCSAYSKTMKMHLDGSDEFNEMVVEEMRDVEARQKRLKGAR